MDFIETTHIIEKLGTSQNKLIKHSQESSAGLLQGIKSYFGNRIDPNDKTGSLLNAIAPGAISLMLSKTFGWYGTLAGLAMSILHVDTAGILSKIYDGIKSVVSSGKQIQSSKIDEIVNSSFQTTSTASLGASDIRFIKLALIEYQISKTALPGLLSRGGKITELLKKVFSWVFKIALASAGLLVAGDVVNKVIGKPNAFDQPVYPSALPQTTFRQESQPFSAPVYVGKQTKFKQNKSFANVSHSVPWIEKYQNNKQGIETMLINFAKSIYDGLDGYDGTIKGLESFQNILDQILFTNRNALGDPMVFIPKTFHSKKEIVDVFVDELADKIK